MRSDAQRLVDELVDLLADRVAQRLDQRSVAQAVDLLDQAVYVPPPEADTPLISEAPLERPAAQKSDLPPVNIEAPTGAASLMLKLALGLLVAIAVVNVPLNGQGVALARSIPNSASLVIRNGLLIKEASSPDIWVFRDGAFHWISSIQAFEYFGYRWRDVHIVEPGYLRPFEKGKPVFLLFKCPTSPNVYRLEGGLKRWIIDIPTFEAEGHVWQDVKIVGCDYLRGLPDGESVPAGRGLPPPPLP